MQITLFSPDDLDEVVAVWNRTGRGASVVLSADRSEGALPLSRQTLF